MPESSSTAADLQEDDPRSAAPVSANVPRLHSGGILDSRYAAAYATAALTSIATTPGGDSQSSSWRPLTATEQEAIANQLRAWAGLKGPNAQAEARQALEERQTHLISQAVHHDLPVGRDTATQTSGADDEYGSSIGQRKRRDSSRPTLQATIARSSKRLRKATTHACTTKTRTGPLRTAHSKKAHLAVAETEEDRTRKEDGHKTPTPKAAQLDAASVDGLSTLEPRYIRRLSAQVHRIRSSS